MNSLYENSLLLWLFFYFVLDRVSQIQPGFELPIWEGDPELPIVLLQIPKCWD